MNLRTKKIGVAKSYIQVSQFSAHPSVHYMSDPGHQVTNLCTLMDQGLPYFGLLATSHFLENIMVLEKMHFSYGLDTCINLHICWYILFIFYYLDFYKLLLLRILHNLENLTQNKYHPDVYLLLLVFARCGNAPNMYLGYFLLLKYPFFK